jgi:type I site-specific restriction endonuclease
MELSEENQRYDEQWDLVDTFYNTNEPEGFGSTITPDEAEALKTYYFVNPNEHNVYEYSEQLAIDKPALVEKAKMAARKIAVAEDLSDEEVKALFA